MGKTQPHLTVNRVLEVIDSTVETWVEAQGTDLNVYRIVKAELDKSLLNIVHYAIGIKRNNFDCSLEVNTSSPGFALLKDRLEGAARQWLEENFERIDSQPLSKEIVVMKQHCAREYNSSIKKELSKLAAEKAQKDAKLIIDRVGLTTDKMREALESVITKEEVATAAEEAARGKEFLQRTKLSSAVVRGVVAYDGEKLSELTQEPDACCWHAVQLTSVFDLPPDADCHILTNGKEWHPLLLHYENGPIWAHSRVMEHFTSSQQMIFNFLDEADRLFIAQAIVEHYQRDQSDQSHIPF